MPPDCQPWATSFAATAGLFNADLVDEDVRDAARELGLGRIVATGSNT